MTEKAISEHQINLLGLRVRITGQAEVLKSLKSILYPKCYESCESSPDICYEIKKTKGGYNLYRKGDGLVLEAKDLNRLFWWLEYRSRIH